MTAFSRHCSPFKRRERAKKNLTQNALLRRQVEATKIPLELTEINIKAIEESNEIDRMFMCTNDITEEAKEYSRLKQAMVLSKVCRDAAANLFPDSVAYI